MEYWYLWLLLIVLCVITVFVLSKASAAAKKHNNERDALLREYDLKSKGLDIAPNVSNGDLLKELVFNEVLTPTSLAFRISKSSPLPSAEATVAAISTV